ncbi:MAG: large subunit ribosomal protein L20 [Candidatus Paceibacteria bacterium]|jgi:large subunit ribosomal protein L20
MPRVKKGTNANKTRKNKLKLVKGYRFGRSTKEKLANEAISHAGRNAFRDRKTKKGMFRRLWTLRLGAALRANGLSYSKFIGSMKAKNIDLNRKVLSEIAKENPESLVRIIEEVK